ncbi:FRIGIDA-like protein 3 [Linum grandiflorum]
MDGDGVPVSVMSIDGARAGQLSVTQPHLRESIAEFRDRMSSFAADFDSAAAAIDARSRKLRLEEEKLEESRRELEKAHEAARRKSKEFEAREEGFECLMKKEISERRKLAELVEELRKEIEVEKADKEYVEVKLKEIGERGDELESLGGYLEMKAIQVREGEDELEKKRKEVDERFEEFQTKEKKLEEQLAEFRKKQAEFEVRVIELNVKEREIGEEHLEVGFEKRVNDSNRKDMAGSSDVGCRLIPTLPRTGWISGCSGVGSKSSRKNSKLRIRLAELNKKEKEIDNREKQFKEEQLRLREAKLAEELAAFKQKEAEFEVHVVELKEKTENLKKREREIIEKAEKCRELEANTQACSYELMEKKLEDRFNMLSKRMDELELKRVKDLESIEKKGEMMSKETVMEDERPAKSVDHSSEANIRHCGMTSGNDVEMTEKQAEMSTGDIAMEAKKPAESLNRSSEVNIRICAITSGKDLQIFMNEHSDDYESVKDEVENALKLSSDPAKLVLDAMEGFYPPRLKKGGIEFEEGVVRKNCIMLLEWVTKMSPPIKSSIKEEAKEIAFDWKSKMKSDVEHSLEVLAFLQLLAAFELANDFWYDLEKMLGIVAHYSQAPLLLRDLYFGDKMARVIEKKLMEKENQAEAEGLISAFELDSEFPSVISPETHRKEFNLGSLLGNTVPTSSSNTVLRSPDLQTLSSKCSGAKRSWSDACADDNHTPAHLPDKSNVTAQQPEKSSGDQAGCSNPISINSDSEEDERNTVDSGEGKENDSGNSEEERDSEDCGEEHVPGDSEEKNDSGDSEEEHDSGDSEEPNEDDSLPRILSFVPQCLEGSGTSLHSLVWDIRKNKLRCIEICDALRFASDPAEFVLGVVKNPSSLNLKAGLRLVCLESPEHGPLLLLNYLWRMSPHIKPNARREALSFAKDWISKLAEQIKDHRLEYAEEIKENIEGVSFLLFLAAYKLEGYFEHDELFNVFGHISDVSKKLYIWRDITRHGLADEKCKALISDLEKKKRALQEHKIPKSYPKSYRYQYYAPTMTTPLATNLSTSTTNNNVAAASSSTPAQKNTGDAAVAAATPTPDVTNISTNDVEASSSQSEDEFEAVQTYKRKKLHLETNTSKERAPEKGKAGDGSFEEEGQDVETQRPLKRLRDQEGLVSPSAGDQGSPTSGVRVPVSVASTDCSTGELSITGFQNRLSSFAMEFESTTAAIEARSRKLRLEEEKVEESRKELEKAHEAARRKSKEFEAREEAFEILMKKEISERRKLAELVDELRKEIEVDKAEKESVEVKLKGLRERGDELEALGGYLEMKAIQVREGEEELEKKRKEVDERFEQFKSKEQKLEEQLEEFRKKQPEFEVRVIELNVKEREIGEEHLEVGFEKRVDESNRKDMAGSLEVGCRLIPTRPRTGWISGCSGVGSKSSRKNSTLLIRLAELKKKEKEMDNREKEFKEEQLRLRGAKFEEELAEFKKKQAEFEVCVVELKVREKEISEKEKKYRELEANTQSCSYELMQKKLQEQFNMLSERMDELELKRVKDLESIEKKAEMTSKETLMEDERPGKPVDHSFEVNIRHCVITSGEDVEMTAGEIAVEAEKPAESLNRSSEVNIKLFMITSGKDLQIFLNEHSNDYDSVKDEVENALKLSSDPAKLVLDAMEGFYPPRLKKGDVKFEEAVVRKNCIMLLEWVTKMSPHIKSSVEEEARQLACDWKSKMKSDAEHSLEVLAYLQLYAAFELADCYDQSELLDLLGIISHYNQAPLLLRDLGFADEMASEIEKKLLVRENRAEAAGLISAFELESEFPSVILPGTNHRESNLVSLLGNNGAVPVPMSSSNGVLSTPESQTLFGKCSGAKRSRTDAFSEGNDTESTGPAQLQDRSGLTDQPAEDSNVTAQQPEAGGSNPISVNSFSSEEKENKSEDSEEAKDNDSEDFEEEYDCNDSEEENEDESLPGTVSFVPQCLEGGGAFIDSLVQKIGNKELRCIPISDALRLASDPGEFVLGIVKNPSSLNLKEGLRSLRLKNPKHGPLLLLNYLWQMMPHIKRDARIEALSFARGWRSKLSKKMKYNEIEGVSFLLFLAVYRLERYFDEDELFSVFGSRSWWLPATQLLVILGLKNFIPLRRFIGYLVNKEPEDALLCIEEAKAYRCDSSAWLRLGIYREKPRRGSQQLKDIDRELDVWYDVESHNLADETCKGYISDLEKEKQALLDSRHAKTKARYSKYQPRKNTGVAAAVASTPTPAATNLSTTNGIAASSSQPEDELAMFQPYKRKKLTFRPLKERAPEKGMAGDQGSFEEEGQDVETQRPLKRLRDQEGVVSSLAGDQSSLTTGVRVPFSVASTDCSSGELSITGFRDRLSSFAMEFESTTVAIEARSRKLRLEEEKVDESRKELEKAHEAARQKSQEFEAREDAFECLMKKEISERRKLAELVEELRKEIEVEKADKESVEVKLKEIEERGDYLESLGGYLEMKAIQVREGEEELEKKRKEVDELFEQFKSKEKKFEEQWTKFRQKQAEFGVPVIELNVKEREIGEKDVILDMRLAELKKKEKEIDDREQRCKEAESIIKQFRLREAKFEEELAAFKQKQAELEVRVVGLNAKEREIDEKVKQCREAEANMRTCSYELIEKKLNDRFNILSKRIDELELKRVTNLESIEKVELTREETIVENKRPAKSLDHSSEANIKHCASGKDIEMLEQQVEMTSGETLMKAKKPIESLDRSLEVNIRGCVLSSGKDLQIFLNEHSYDYDSLKDEVESALKLSSDPAKLVLDAMEGFYPPHLKKGGIEFEESVVRKNCLMLLEWVTKMSLLIEPEVKKEALKLALDWIRKLKSDAEHSLEVIAFLQFLAAFELASCFRPEQEKLLVIIAHCSQAPLLLRDLDCVFHMENAVIKKKLRRKADRAEAAELISAFELNSEFPSVILPKKSSNDQAGCSNPISINSEQEKKNDSQDTGEGNEGRSLPRILSLAPQCLKANSTYHPNTVELIRNNKLLCIEVSDALRHASDPAAFVLGVVKNPSSLKLKAGRRSARLISPAHGPLLLLNYLWQMSPHVKPNVRIEALSFAKDWISKLAEKMDEGGVCFLLFLAAYKLDCYFDKDTLFSVFGRGCWCRTAAELLAITGLKNSIPSRQFIGYLVGTKRPQPLEALWCIRSANMLESDPSATACLTTFLDVPLRMYKCQPQLRDVIDELAVWKYVVKHNLADETCKAYILDLEKRKQKLELKNPTTEPAYSSTLAPPLPKIGVPRGSKSVKGSKPAP